MVRSITWNPNSIQAWAILWIVYFPVTQHQPCRLMTMLPLPRGGSLRPSSLMVQKKMQSTSPHPPSHYHPAPSSSSFLIASCLLSIPPTYFTSSPPPGRPQPRILWFHSSWCSEMNKCCVCHAMLKLEGMVTMRAYSDWQKPSYSLSMFLKVDRETEEPVNPV